MLQILEKLLPIKSLRRSGQKLLGVRFLVLHDTGNDSSTADGNVSYFIRSANEMQASAHYFVDDKQIINCIPESEKAWHVRYDLERDNKAYGDDANDRALSIELCWSSKKTIDNEKAYQNYVDLAADICKRYKLDPYKDIVSHAWLDPNRRTDPISALKLMGKTWQQLLGDIAGQLNLTELVAPISPKRYADLIKEIQENKVKNNSEKTNLLLEKLEKLLSSL